MRKERKYYFSEWIQDTEAHWPESGSPGQNVATFVGQVPCEVTGIKWPLGKKGNNTNNG